MPKHKYHEPKDCPLCEKIIFIFDKKGKPVKLNDSGMTFWVLFNDGTNAEFSICKDCFNTLNQEKLDKIMSDEIYTWGMQIICEPLGLLDLVKQLRWYVETAVHLRIVKYARDKNGL